MPLLNQPSVCNFGHDHISPEETVRINIVRSSQSRHPSLYFDLEVAKKMVVCGFNPRNWGFLTLEVQRFLIESWCSLELSHLCRIVILKQVRKHSDIARESAHEKIEKLPLPKPIKQYLRFL